MAVMKNFDGNEIYIDCYCGCNDGIRFRIDKTDPDLYCFTTYTNGNFYREQSDSIFRVIRKKMKKIWAIIRNKDFYYSDVMMTKDEFEEFRSYINSVDEENSDDNH